MWQSLISTIIWVILFELLQKWLKWLRHTQSTVPYSLEAKHLIWVWIMKVKGSKIEVLYVVVNAWGATLWNTWEYGKRLCQTRGDSLPGIFNYVPDVLYQYMW